MSEAADVPIPHDTPPNARQPALVVNMGDEEFTQTGLLVRASGTVLMGNPTDFEKAG